MIEKACRTCGISKPLDAFFLVGRTTGERPSRGAHGRVPDCKACKSHLRKPSLAEERRERASLDAAGLKRCNVCRATKPLADFATRRASPDGVSSTCRVCANIRSAQWKEAHPGAHKQWYDENRDWKRQYFQQWRQANAERVKQGYRTWAKANKARINALIAKRNAIKLKATPPWADHSAIRAIYKEASRLTAETGIRHEVDHVVPLRHPRVCGLHVAANMQILTSDENKRKSNQFPLASESPASDIRALRNPLNMTGCALAGTSSASESSSASTASTGGSSEVGVAAAAS